MIEYYKKRANEYERIYCKPERKIYIEEFKSYLSNYFMNRNVLELACGTGFWTECISLTAKSIKATDINDSVLEIAKTKNYRSDCKIDFTIMDFKNKEEYKKSDAIFIGFLVSHLSIEEFDQLLNNLLKNSTNQKILLMDNIYLEGESTKISKTDLLGNTYQIRSLEDGSSHEIMKNFYTKEDLQKLVQKYKNNFKIKQNKYYWSLEIST